MKKLSFYLSIIALIGVFTSNTSFAEQKYTAVDGSGKVVTVENPDVIAPVVFTAPSPVSLGKMKHAILAGCPVRNWVPSESGNNAITATLNIRKHKVSVLITYDTKGFKISYKNSYNLVDDSNCVHRNYKNWVTNLSSDIAKNLVSLD